MSPRAVVPGLLLGTAVLALASTGAAAPRAGDADRLLDPAYVAAGACRPRAEAAGSPLAPYLRLAAATVPAPRAGDAPPPLWDGLGDLTFPVATVDPTAQRYFDQGLRLTYGFNHAEALRAFRHAQTLDPACAMCFWGEALVLGANLNAPMNAGNAAPADAAARKAVALAGRASPRERALILALAERYAAGPSADRKALDRAYADAMTGVAARFPDDPNVATLHADAVMNLSPWDYWEADGVTSKGRAGEAVRALERALADHPDHPGAIHLYIHVMEASARPERAERHADRLAALMPAAGHIVHMPSHIYFRVGRYRDSLEVNRRAAAADAAYLVSSGTKGVYASAYYPHNLHFLMTSAQMAGAAADAVRAAEALPRTIDPDVARAVPWVQPIMAAPYFAHAQFGAPEAVLALPDPGDAFPFVRAMWRYARGTAHAARGDAAAARGEAAAIARVQDGEPFADLAAGGVPAAAILRLAGHVLDGRIAQARDDRPGAVRAFEAAVAVQDSFPYTEPPYWYYPVRRSLGAALLRAGDAAGAERVLARSLIDAPNDGRALFGLMEARKARGDAAGAAAAGKLLDAAWAGDRRSLDLARL